MKIAKLLDFTRRIDGGRSVSAENVMRWTSQGDARQWITLQNEGPTIAMNGQIYESLVT